MDKEKILSVTANGEAKRIDQILEDAYANLTAPDKNYIFLDTGFNEYNRVIGGIEMCTNTVIGARPGVGKTMIALTLLFNMFKLNKNVKLIALFWNWEMTNEQQMHRLFSQKIKKSTKALKTDELTKDEKIMMYELLKEHADENIFFIDIAADVNRIGTLVRNIKSRYPNHSIVNIFDHTRLVKKEANSMKSEEARLFDLYAEANNIKKIGCANILLSQLNREIDKDMQKSGTYRPPTTADLFGADAAQQFADVTILLHRPEKYGVLEWEKYSDSDKKIKIKTKNRLWCEVGKNRNGASDVSFVLNYDPVFNHITNIEEDDAQLTFQNFKINGG